LSYFESHVESSWPKQRRVEHVGAVRGCDDDDTLEWREAVHLHQQLVERLLALLVNEGSRRRAPLARHRVELVDEDDARRVLLCVLEQVAHPRRADTDEQLDEVRARRGKQGHLGLAGQRPGQQGLSKTWSTLQEHATRSACAGLLPFL